MKGTITQFLERQPQTKKQIYVRDNFDVEELIGNERVWFRNIFSKGPIGIVIHANDGSIYANTRLCEILGYRKNELKSFTVKTVTHPADVDLHLADYDRLLAGEIDHFRLEKRYIRKDGSICWAEVTIRANRTEDGTIECIITLIDDISERKAAEESLNATDILLDGIFNTALDAIVTVNSEFEVLKWNQQAELTFGYKKEEAIGRSLRHLIFSKNSHEFDVEKLHLLMKSRQLDAIRQRREVWVLNKDGLEFPAELSISPICIKEEYLFGIFIRDITDRVASQQALKDKINELDEKNRELKRYASSNSQLENFAYVASHDLKEPLRTIGNFVQLLEKRLGNKVDDTDREFIQFIVGGVKNMNNLINDLLTYSRVNTQEHSLSEIVTEDALFITLRSLDKKIQETKTKVRLKSLPRKVVANKTKFKQIFQNLIANAIKFRKKEEKCVIEISGKEDENFWYFTISDNGIGIKKDFYDKIFELFKKLHAKSEYQGSGIGLAVCKRIVEQHRGSIWVESEVGKGTCFHFSFAKQNAEL